MILESLTVLLFGMIGIFFVMGIIIGALYILKRFSGEPKSEEKDET